MVESILRNCGYRTGLFTSPHLWTVRERIQINGYGRPAASLLAVPLVIESGASNRALNQHLHTHVWLILLPSHAQKGTLPALLQH